MIDWHNVINKLDLDNGVCVSFDNIDNIPVGDSGYEEILENFKKANRIIATKKSLWNTKKQRYDIDMSLFN